MTNNPMTTEKEDAILNLKIRQIWCQMTVFTSDR